MPVSEAPHPSPACEPVHQALERSELSVCPSSYSGSSPRATLAKFNLLSGLPLLSYPCSSFSLISNPCLTIKILFAHFLFLNHRKSLGCDAKGTKPPAACPSHPVRTDVLFLWPRSKTL